ncbi:hypothetical protein R3P38DRAFT_2543461, partial [Favolaschia claudopus]
INFWEMLQVNKAVLPLAKFALQLLHLVVNQAGLEQWFSDFSNKKSKKWNRLSLKKMAQQAKVTRFIRQEQKAEGLTDERTKRKNHEDSRVQQLLTVPRYADAILSDTDDSENEGGRRSVVIRTSTAWRRQVAEWQAETRELDAAVSDPEEDDDDEELPPSVPLPAPGRRRTQRSWFPTTLASLFGGQIDNPFTISRRERVVSEESLYMELFAAEHSGEEPDDGALSGSGDEYRG